MKLFSPKEVEKLKNNSSAQQLEDIRQLNELFLKSSQDYETNKIRLENEKLHLEEDFIIFVEEKTASKNLLINEVNNLEERKKIASEPLTQKEYEIGVQKQSLDERERQVLIKEEELVIGMEQLRDRLDLLDDKISDLKEREESLKKQEDVSKLQKEFLKESTNELNAKWEKFNETIAKITKEHQTKDFEIKTQKESIEIIKESLEKDKEDLRIHKIKLDDREQTLQASWQELRSKNG